jgi:hypothetical protein
MKGVHILRASSLDRLAQMSISTWATGAHIPTSLALRQPFQMNIAKRCHRGEATKQEDMNHLVQHEAIERKISRARGFANAHVDVMACVVCSVLVQGNVVVSDIPAGPVTQV